MIMTLKIFLINEGFMKNKIQGLAKANVNIEKDNYNLQHQMEMNKENKEQMFKEKNKMIEILEYTIKSRTEKMKTELKEELMKVYDDDSDSQKASTSVQNVTKYQQCEYVPNSEEELKNHKP